VDLRGSRHERPGQPGTTAMGQVVRHRVPVAGVDRPRDLEVPLHHDVRQGRRRGPYRPQRFRPVPADVGYQAVPGGLLARVLAPGVRRLRHHR
jgi:hypothetical protein